MWDRLFDKYLLPATAPAELSDAGRDDLRRTGRAALLFFAVQVPVWLWLIAGCGGAGRALGFLLAASSAVAAGLLVRRFLDIIIALERTAQLRAGEAKGREHEVHLLKTDQQQRERAADELRELLTVYEKALGNRAAFVAFCAEAGEGVRRLTEGPPQPTADLRRLIGDLKAECSVYGLKGLSDLCHEIAGRLSPLSAVTADGGTTAAPGQGDQGDQSDQGDLATLSAADRAELLRRWRHFADRIDRLIGSETGRIELDEEELDEFRQRVAAGLPRPQILETVSSWSLPPTRAKLEHFAERASDLARRLGKCPVRVDVESNHLRLSLPEWAVFWDALGNVVRNAVDHGLETPPERRAQGKPLQATLGLRTYLRNKQFIVEVSDDGRGIDWEKVAAKARGLGLPCRTPDEVVEALFADGLSVLTEGSESCGKGLGLGAVRRCCERLGGVVKVVSEVGKGTLMAFRFPVAAMTGEQVVAGDFRASSLTISPKLSYAAVLKELGQEGRS